MSEPSEPVVIATGHTWIQSEAVEQLHRIAALPGAVAAAGMPDLHPGAGAPIGAALLADRVYPHLVGSDIGCGVAVWPLSLRRASPDRLATRLAGLETTDDLPDDWADRFDAPRHDTLGTVGGGNHFVEIAAVDEIFTDAPGWTTGTPMLMIHTGSRGLGRQVLQEHTDTHGPHACPPDGVQDYLRRHDEALRFGRANRAALAWRVAERLGVDLDPESPLIDVCHNSVTRHGTGWLHRKGAVPVPDAGDLVALPGSRGTRSHILSGTGDEPARARALWSVAHGAGRKHSRAAARARFKELPRRELTTTRLGSRVICEDAALLTEEAPGAYKDIEDVITALEAARLGTRVVALRPLVTYKTEAATQHRDRARTDRARERRRRGR